MEDRETPRTHKYGESKTTQIMMATVRLVTACAGRTKYQADGFLFDGVYRGGGILKPVVYKTLVLLLILKTLTFSGHVVCFFSDMRNWSLSLFDGEETK